MRLSYPICAVLLLSCIAARADVPAGATPMQLPVAELLRPNTHLTLPLPGGVSMTFDTQVQALGHGDSGVYGRSPTGDRLLMFTAPGRLDGDIYAAHGRYRLIAEGDRHYWAPLRELPAEPPFFEPARAPDTGARNPKLAPLMAAPGPDGLYQIDLLTVVSPALVTAFGGEDKMRDEVESLTFQANAYFKTSSIPVKYHLVDMQRYPGTQVPGASESTANDPAMRELRNAAGADLAILMDACICQGQASVFNGGYLTAEGAAPEHLDADHDAFAWMCHQAACGAHDFAHELGHTMGGGHDANGVGVRLLPGIGNGPASPLIGDGYWKPYAHGAECGHPDKLPVSHYATVMAYGDPAFDYAADFFSSPALIVDGEACGAQGNPDIEATQADNARSITQAAPYVAAYREPVAPVAGKRAPVGHFGSGALAPVLLLTMGLATLIRRRRAA